MVANLKKIRYIARILLSFTITASLCFTVACTGWSVDTVQLSINGSTVLEYQPNPNPNKTYLGKLYSPTGAQVLLDSPADHVHHHGLMLGLDVEGISFWLDGAAKGINQLNLFTKLHYSGLGMRLPKSMDDNAAFTFVNPGESTLVRAREKLTFADCAACTGVLDTGKKVTVAMFATPRSDRQTPWFTMSGTLTYISATKNFYRCPEVLRHGDAIEFIHGIAVWDGAVDQSTLAETAAAWSKLADLPTPDPLREEAANFATPDHGTKPYASTVRGAGYEAGKAIDSIKVGKDVCGGKPLTRWGQFELTRKPSDLRASSDPGCQYPWHFGSALRSCRKWLCAHSSRGRAIQFNPAKRALKS
ncbi:MAG: PmoA family protein [Kiritimatiellae bacterium]|nr:PmoA family protein [Kiritimatiellia bacterium]